MKLDDTKYRIDWIDQARGILFLCVILFLSNLSSEVIYTVKTSNPYLGGLNDKCSLLPC